MSDANISLDEIWAEAQRQFQDICGQSLQRGDVKSFDDVRRKIENLDKQPNGASDDQEDRWDKAKNVGLQSLKLMKMLIGAASQAATFIPIPPAAANIAGSALSFVFDIPERIRGYNEAVDRVFSDVASALAQFQIYESLDRMHHMNPLLVQQIHLVIASVVRICAHVVKYQQGRRRDRLAQHFATIVYKNESLDAEMSEFRRLIQTQHYVEGTVTLSVLVETRSEIAGKLESLAVISKTVEETHQGVQALKDDNDRTKILNKIGNTLQVPPIVLLHTRTTQTCTNIAAKCLPGTGSWIWTDSAFVSWTAAAAKGGENNSSNVLVVSGRPLSGKTLATAQIVKRLEEEKDRTYVAHYFFLPASNKQVEDDNKYPVHSALRYMAFQLARVDATVRKALGKACDSENASVLSRNSSSNLDSLWAGLKIGAPGSGPTYYLAFDGIENLGEKEREMLLKFIFSPKLAEDSAGRVRVLVSGTDQVLENNGVARNALRISMERYNESDMRIFIQNRLDKQGLLRRAKEGSVQQKAKDKILATLPQKAAGSYSQLQFVLDEVVRLLGSRTSFKELEKVLDHPMNSHETAIKALQRSLTPEEVGELNELLKWVHFSSEQMTVEELEAAMLLYSGTESVGLLQDIITSKYLAVLKISESEDGLIVEGQEGALDCLCLEKDRDDKARHTTDDPTISMTINIKNVDEVMVHHFLWDLAQKAIRDQFRFSFDAAANTLHTRQNTICVNEFEAHRTIVMRAFQYLSEEPRDETKSIGRYLFWWLPYHLAQLTRLDEEDKGSLMPSELLEIGEHLYQLLKDQEIYKRHKDIVERYYWTAEEMEDVKKWLMDRAVVRKLPKQWREEISLATSPVRGYLKPLGKMIVETWLRDPEQQTPDSLLGSMAWVREFMKADTKVQPLPQTPHVDTSGASSPATGGTSQVDWYHVSAWCQEFLELADSDVEYPWWRRIALAAEDGSIEDPELIMKLHRRALEQDDNCWGSRYGMADCQFRMGCFTEAISELKLALKATEREDVRTKPEEGDTMRVHFRLGDCYLEDGNAEQAADEYSLVSRSEDPYWAEKGQVAYMKARLSSDDAKGAEEMLRNTLSKGDGEGSMVNALKMIAREDTHSIVMSRMFTVAKGDPDLLNGVMAALKKATTPGEDKATEMSEGDRFAEDESRGVLLYHRGMTVAHILSPGDTGSVRNALTFWHQCRDLLDDIGGPVASTTRTNATTELAKYYFHSLLKNQRLQEDFEALAKLAEEDSGVEGGNAVGYVAALHVLRDDRGKAKASLLRRIKIALQVLSDDEPDNDCWGYSALFKSLAHYRDFRNSAASLALLGQPDLVTDALHFQDVDIDDGDGVDKSEVLDLVSELAKEVSQAIKSKVPDSSEQTQRIEVAKEHVDTLAATDSQKTRATALTLLTNRLSTLQANHTSYPEHRFWPFVWTWCCDGLGAPGTKCGKVCDFDHGFYHCIYCTDCDFCPGCFKQLREGSTPIMQCSAAHMWIRIPPQGSDFYCGPRAKTVRVPVVRPVEADEQVLEACYPEEEEIQELTLEEWKAALAKEWDIALGAEDIGSQANGA